MIILLAPPSKLAAGLLYLIRKVLNAFGINRQNHLDELIYIIVVILVAIFLSWGIRYIVIKILRKILSLRNSDLAQDMLHLDIVSKSTHIIPPLVLMTMLPFVFEWAPIVHEIILRALWVYFVITVGVGLNAFLSLIWMRFDHKENSERHPLRGLLATAHGIVWIFVAIICISIIIDKSPGALLTGMAAMSAALILIFKDSILGFVAGIQLSQNDMLRVGDWIVVTGTPANGNVEDVSLTVVKVRSWDNTLVMIPPYTLVSTSFINYRGMFEMGRRRIDQQFNVDFASVKPADDELLQKISMTFPEMKPFIDRSVSAKAQGQGPVYNGGTADINGTIETNLGLFRAYLCQYLQAHPGITDQQYLMVRIMSPTETGIPVQIYCFTSGDSVFWVKYEAIQSEIMEHIIVTAPVFGLEIYNAMSRNKLTLETAQIPPQPESKAEPQQKSQS